MIASLGSHHLGHAATHGARRLGPCGSPTTRGPTRCGIQLREQVEPGDGAEGVDVAPDVVADLDINGHIIGLEILNASQQLGAAVLAESVPIEQLVGAMAGAWA